MSTYKLMHHVKLMVAMASYSEMVKAVQEIFTQITKCCSTNKK